MDDLVHSEAARRPVPAPEVAADSVCKASLTGAPGIRAWLRSQLYTHAGLKQVPPIILNADAEARRVAETALQPA